PPSRCTARRSAETLPGRKYLPSLSRASLAGPSRPPRSVVSVMPAPLLWVGGDQPGLGAPGRAYCCQVRTVHPAKNTAQPMKKASGDHNERAAPTRKGPKAAIEDVKPMTPPALRRSKIIGICLNVPALPIPAKVKIASMPPRKRPNWLTSLGVRKKIVNMVLTVMPIPATKVHSAPPNLSHNGPHRARVAEPSKGPRKANLSGSGAFAKLPYCSLMSRPSWAAKPENAPKVIV